MRHTDPCLMCELECRYYNLNPPGREVVHAQTSFRSWKNLRVKNRSNSVPAICETAAAQNDAEKLMYSANTPPIRIPSPIPLSHDVRIDELAVPR